MINIKTKTRAQKKKPKRQPKQALTKINKRGNMKARRLYLKKRNIEIVEKVISPRMRPHPMAAAPYGQSSAPQSYWFDSTAIKDAAYDKQKQVLQITWINNATYLYYGVPEYVWRAFNQASSKGRFAYYNIRTSYNYTRIK